MAMVPVAELQVSIPVALGVYKLPALSAYLWAIFGNLVPVAVLLLYLDPISKYLMARTKFFNKFFSWIFNYTRGRFTQKYIKYGEAALFLFIAVPTPLSGAWSSSLAAFLFGIPFRRAFFLIAVGELIAGAIILGVSSGVFTFLHI